MKNYIDFEVGKFLQGGKGNYRETWKAPKISGILYLGTTMDSLTTVVFV